MTEAKLVYVDENFIVINKPAGLPVHGGAQIIGKTLIDFLLKKFPEIAGVGENPLRPGIVHRLDKNTSGIMVVARNRKSFETLKDLFRTRRVEKTYWAVVCGRPKEQRGTISVPIGRKAHNPTKRGVAAGKAEIRGAREAITEYRVIMSGKIMPSSGDKITTHTIYSLVELKPKTGRMHQLRVHMKFLGNPIACDKVYGGKKVCCPATVSRQLLHAKSLSFSYGNGRRFNFEADPPQDMAVVIKNIF